VKKDVLEQTQLLCDRTPFIPSLPTVTESLTLSLLWIWILAKLEEEVDIFFTHSDRIPDLSLLWIWILAKLEEEEEARSEAEQAFWAS
jgi:hypothetical protein